MMKFMTTETDLAWAAGFIDGEGCLYAEINKRGSVRAILTVSQRRPEALVFLKDLFGAGTMSPVVNKGNPAYIYSIQKREDLVRVLDLIRPYLREKADQADTLREIAGHILKHGGRGRYSLIDKEWCLERVNRLRAQKRPWEPDQPIAI